ncbi:hypothetical protein EVAR_22908_1 [Eumeta japonica]|uniref:Uncharacterized protein n=1 Tax=Eumeta variegata TaxID=151549 RepID=A0A4C1UU92_EUMVA|nr:hypothetical protein EVAR_22908_1 [Eumeta japonica]
MRGGATAVRRSDYASGELSRGAPTRSLAMDPVQCHQIYHRAMYADRIVLRLALRLLRNQQIKKMIPHRECIHSAMHSRASARVRIKNTTHTAARTEARSRNIAIDERVSFPECSRPVDVCGVRVFCTRNYRSSKNQTRSTVKLEEPVESLSKSVHFSTSDFSHDLARPLNLGRSERTLDSGAAAAPAPRAAPRV